MPAAQPQREIRPEAPDDAAAIRAVNEAAFGRPGEADLVDRLREAGALTLSLVAVADGRVVGHVAFSPVTVTDGAERWDAVGLAPVAVEPALQGRGIGGALIREGLARLKASGQAIVFVLGEPAYYSRFGFGPASAHRIRWEHDCPEEAFMVAPLCEGALVGRRGVVRFRPEFDAV